MTIDIDIGKEYVFFYRHDDGDTEFLAPHNAHKCKVMANDTRPDNEEDNAYGGLYEVVFEDGSEFDVYGDELKPIENCVASKHGIYWIKCEFGGENYVPYIYTPRDEQKHSVCQG